MKNLSLLCFLITESVATAAWWVLLFALPSSRHYFVPLVWPDTVLLSFALGDLLLIVGGGALTAVGVLRRASWSQFALGLHLGAVAYAALFTIMAWIATGQSLLAALMMTADAIVFSYFAVMYLRRERKG